MINPLYLFAYQGPLSFNKDLIVFIVFNKNSQIWISLDFTWLIRLTQYETSPLQISARFSFTEIVNK